MAQRPLSIPETDHEEGANLIEAWKEAGLTLTFGDIFRAGLKDRQNFLVRHEAATKRAR
jgi:hypothetical protein